MARYRAYSHERREEICSYCPKKCKGYVQGRKFPFSPIKKNRIVPGAENNSKILHRFCRHYNSRLLEMLSRELCSPEEQLRGLGIEVKVKN